MLYKIEINKSNSISYCFICGMYLVRQIASTPTIVIQSSEQYYGQEVLIFLQLTWEIFLMFLQ